MYRVLLIFCVIALAAAGAVWLVEHPGDVAITWQGRRIETTLAVLAALVAIGAAILMLAFALLRLLWRLPRLVRGGRRARRQEKGYGALTKGLLAVGAGDSDGARRHAQEARKMLGGDPLALLLDAQASQLAGDREGARQAFRAMTRSSSARVLGWRGLFVEARRAGDGEAASEAAREAAKIAPASGWANEALLADRFARGDWEGARLALERAERLRILDKATSRRQRAVLLAAEAQDLAAVNPERALTLAREACDLAPGLVPAAALAGRLLGERGDLRKAMRIIEAAWKTSPHPDLADAYVHLRSGDTARDRLQRAQTLAKLAPDAADGALAMADAAIAARDFAAARAALASVLAGRPTVRACLLMADLADLDGGDHGAARHWLARATRAPRDPVWMADGVASERWAPVSPATGRLDAFVWTAPPERIGAAPEPALDPAAVPDATAMIDASPSAAPPMSAVAGVVEAPAEPKIEARPDPKPESPPPLAPSAAPAPLQPSPPRGRPTPVVFPVARAPDDPGPKSTEDSRWRGV